MKKTILLLVSLCTLGLNAQDFSFGADVQSRYVWRGIQLGDESASIQPSAELAVGKFAIGAWGAYSLGGGAAIDSVGQEMDLYLSYAISDAVSITVTDYFFPVGGHTQDYLEYGDGTEHVYEATLSVAATDAISLLAAANIGGDEEGSTYLEASYAADQFTLFVGGVIGDDNGYYKTDGEGLINVGISLEKEIALSSTYSLPVNSSLVLNPDAGNVFLTFGFSL